MNIEETHDQSKKVEGGIDKCQEDERPLILILSHLGCRPGPEPNPQEAIYFHHVGLSIHFDIFL